MLASEAHSHPAGGPETLLPLLVVVVATGYLTLAVLRARDEGVEPVAHREFPAGCAVLAVGLIPGLLPFPPGDFRGHMVQHLLTGMYAPIGLALGAPVTLLLRSVPRRAGRLVGRALRSGPAHLVANPITALSLTLGGLAVLYFGPLYDATPTSPVLHHAVHVHFLAAGYLFAWVLAGPDPAPRRPSVPACLVILGIAIAGHAVLSQLLYAGAFVRATVPAEQLRGGAELMYYGGDIAELLLALALVTNWHPRRPPIPRRPLPAHR